MSSSVTRRLKRHQHKQFVQTTLANSSIALAVYAALYGQIPEALVAQVRDATSQARTVEQINQAIVEIVDKFKQQALEDSLEPSNAL